MRTTATMRFLISLISQSRAHGHAIGHRGVRTSHFTATQLNKNIGQDTLYCSDLTLAVNHGRHFAAGMMPMESEAAPPALRKRYAPVSIFPSARKRCVLDGQETTTFPGAS